MTFGVLVVNGVISSGKKVLEDRKDIGSTVQEWGVNGWITIADTPPAFDPNTQRLVMLDIELVLGRPTQLYRVDDLPLPEGATPSLQNQIDALKSLLVTKKVVTVAEVETAVAVEAASVDQAIN